LWNCGYIPLCKPNVTKSSLFFPPPPLSKTGEATSHDAVGRGPLQCSLPQHVFLSAAFIPRLSSLCSKPPLAFRAQPSHTPCRLAQLRGFHHCRPPP
jgi:hypothetical protein